MADAISEASTDEAQLRVLAYVQTRVTKEDALLANA